LPAILLFLLRFLPSFYLLILVYICIPRTLSIFPTHRNFYSVVIKSSSMILLQMILYSRIKIPKEFRKSCKCLIFTDVLSQQ
jgi:hypothetical protein